MNSDPFTYGPAQSERDGANISTKEAVGTAAATAIGAAALVYGLKQGGEADDWTTLGTVMTGVGVTNTIRLIWKFFDRG